jgi:hypothetical protein
VTTCPGSTPLCRRVCYVRCGHFIFPDVKNSYVVNQRMAEDPDFVGWMTGEIHRLYVRVLRLHVSGDFYSPQYIRRWTDIVRACPETVFYGYTRSWSVPELARPLWVLAREPNMQLWLSTDRSMPWPPRWSSAWIAWMAETDEDRPPRPVDLVFRVQRKTVCKTVGKNPVCRYDWGVKPRVTCSECKRCFRSATAPTRKKSYV